MTPDDIAESLDDKDEFGEPPFMVITIIDPKLSANEAIKRAIEALKHPRNSYSRGWNVTGYAVTAYRLNMGYSNIDFDKQANTPGVFKEIEGFLQHEEQLLARPDLAFTDYLKAPGIEITTYVGY